MHERSSGPSLVAATCLRSASLVLLLLALSLLAGWARFWWCREDDEGCSLMGFRGDDSPATGGSVPVGGRHGLAPPPATAPVVLTAETRDGADLQMLIDPAKANKALPFIWSEVVRFFTDLHKPTILALSRPDPKKNITTLLKAYGERRQLRELANLMLILGNRDDIDERQWILVHIAHESDMLNSQEVFINPALVEPFGLTIIKAAAYGLPVVEVICCSDDR
ncbi:sucrose-phosphate synthase [Hordeum vulgare]|nr:sucrose-phosphate synthase [Hordeum vulgare]